MKLGCALIAFGIGCMIAGMLIITVGAYVPEPRPPSIQEILFYGGAALTSLGVLRVGWVLVGRLRDRARR